MVDGRDVEALCHVFQQAAQVKSKPTAVVAKTFRGHGMPRKEVLLSRLWLSKTCLAYEVERGLV